MFAGFMMNTWAVATIVAAVAGVVGFFVVLRGSAFPAHAIPKGAFAGAAGASLLGISTLLGLAVFSLLGALGIGALGRRSRHDVATALALVMMLALGAAFLSRTTEYEPEIYSLLFGEVLGVSTTELLPVAALGAVCIAAVIVLYRPLMLSSVVPEIAEAKGIRSHRMEICFLIVVALATAMTVPVVGALLIFSLMIGPPAAARSLTSRRRWPCSCPWPSRSSRCGPRSQPPTPGTGRSASSSEPWPPSPTGLAAAGPPGSAPGPSTPPLPGCWPRRTAPDPRGSAGSPCSRRLGRQRAGCGGRQPDTDRGAAAGRTIPRPV